MLYFGSSILQIYALFWFKYFANLCFILVQIFANPFIISRSYLLRNQRIQMVLSELKSLCGMVIV